MGFLSHNCRGCDELNMKVGRVRDARARTGQKKAAMRHQTCHKGNLFPCPYPYVTMVMIHDIHPDSDTWQLEFQALFPFTSIWTTGYWRQLESMTVRRSKSKGCQIWKDHDKIVSTGWVFPFETPATLFQPSYCELCGYEAFHVFF